MKSTEEEASVWELKWVNPLAWVCQAWQAASLRVTCTLAFLGLVLTFWLAIAEPDQIVQANPVHASSSTTEVTTQAMGVSSLSRADFMKQSMFSVHSSSSLRPMKAQEAHSVDLTEVKIDNFQTHHPDLMGASFMGHNLTGAGLYTIAAPSSDSDLLEPNSDQS